MFLLPQIPGGGVNEPPDDVIKPVIMYHEDGSQEQVYILDKSRKMGDKAARRHYKITQVYMVVSIAAIVITSIIALIQIRKK